MEVPTWAFDEHLALTDNPSALKVALTLYRYGSPQVSAEGHRRCYYRGTKAKLAALSHVSKRSLDAAIVELVEAGIVVQHNVSDTRQGIAVSALTVRETKTVRGATVAPPSESENAVWGATVAPPSESENAYIHVVVVNQDDPDPEVVNNNMLCERESERGATVAPLLQSIGVGDADAWLKRWPARDIVGAVEIATTQPGVENPGGLARHLLRRGFKAKHERSSPVEKAEPAIPWDIQGVLHSAAWQHRRDSVNPLTRRRVEDWLSAHPEHDLRVNPDGNGDRARDDPRTYAPGGVT